MRTAVITIVAGRTAHLRRQAAAVAAAAPELQVLVAMGAGEAARVRAVVPPQAAVLEVPAVAGELPLAAARNAGAVHALAAGAELLVFLDVDCLPGPGLLGRYRAAAVAAGDALLCGPVAYLPPPPPGGYPADVTGLGRAHPARPVPPEDGLQRGGDHRLFWTLSFALTAAAWARVGGFDEGYVGYGGEDTDLGQRARAAGVDLCWVGGAWAHHQHHATSTPPVQHLHAILRNAGRFHDRWGWWPMEGWLDAFAVQGLARLDHRRWVATRPVQD